MNNSVDEIQPYQNIYNDNLVKINVINNDLFHAIMIGYSNRYLKSTLDKRIEIVKSMREYMVKLLTQKECEQIRTKNLIVKEFMELANSIVNGRDFSVINSIDNKELCNLLVEILVENQILNDINLLKPDLEQIIELTTDNIKTTFQDLDTYRCEYFTSHMTTFIADIWLEAKRVCQENITNQFKNPEELLGEEFIPFLSQTLNRDIYVLQNGKLKPDKGVYKNRKSIIIDFVEPNQWSAIGKRLYSSDIEWSFDYDYNIIQKINPNKQIERSPMSNEKTTDTDDDS